MLQIIPADEGWNVVRQGSVIYETMRYDYATAFVEGWQKQERMHALVTKPQLYDDIFDERQMFFPSIITQEAMVPG